MAADEYLLDHGQQPTLRLYSWEGPWLSLGYSQRPQPLPRGLPVVRRPSGGRAVLHHREITYAIVLPEAQGSVAECYEQLTELWRQTLAHHGVEKSAGATRSHTNASCYQMTQRGEICLNGQKLIGSAQVRRGNRLLQHGSIPTGLDRELFERVFPGGVPPASLPGLTCAEIVSHFPQPLREEAWSSSERSEIRQRCQR